MENNSKEHSDSIRTESIQWDSTWPALAEPGEREFLLEYLENRFGIGQNQFNDFLFFRKKKSWWICTEGPLFASVCRLRISRIGMKAFQQVGQFLKPTTRFIQLFGSWATKSTLVVSESELLRLQQGEVLYPDLELAQGYVILKLDEARIIGLGLYVNGRVRSQLSTKALRVAMLEGDE
ncbi:MAG: hypothetical protein P8Y00_01725 [Deltaproteobacteria bacterium]